MTISDKLRLIAKAIEDGREIQVKFAGGGWITPGWIFETERVWIYEDGEYRAKPVKPRTMALGARREEFIQLTPEVIAALKDAGVDYDRT